MSKRTCFALYELYRCQVWGFLCVSLSFVIPPPLKFCSPRLWSHTWGCRGHVRLSCGWPLVDRSSGASSRRQRRIYYRLTWNYPHYCCSPKAPSISSFCKWRIQNAIISTKTVFSWTFFFFYKFTNPVSQIKNREKLHSTYRGIEATGSRLGRDR